MATLVSPFAPAAATVSRERDGWRFGLGLTALLTVFALAVHGYHPYAEDGGLYLAGVLRRVDPALFPAGRAFVEAPMRVSGFAGCVAWMVRASGLGLRLGVPVVVLALHVMTVWATLFAGWMIARRCWTARGARVGAVGLLACWLGMPVAGTALVLMDPYLTARSFSVPCMLLACAGVPDWAELDWAARGGASRRRWRGGLVAGCSLAVAGWMHPLMGVYGAGAALALCAAARLRGRAGWVAAGGALLGCLALAAGLQMVATPESAEYTRIALTRSYWFLGAWRWYEVFGAVAPVAILAWIGWRSARAAVRALARAGAACGVVAAVVAGVFARADAAAHLLARLQPMRALVFSYAAMSLLLGAWVGERVLRSDWRRWVLAGLLLGAPMLGASRAVYGDSPHVEAPWVDSQNGWVRAFLWVRENTPKDALFALPADYIHAEREGGEAFRAIAERSALADFSKDGGEAAIAPWLAQEWVTEQAAQAGLETELDADRVARLRPLGVSWVVLPASARTKFACGFTDEAVRVCRLP